MQGLMLHTGASTVTLDQVIDAPTPERTATWVPIPHHTLLAKVEQSLNGVGLQVSEYAHGLTKDGARYFGLMQVGDSTGQFGLVVGVRNSHDKSFPAAIALGAKVFVCDNLSFSGEIKLARKHTAFIERDLPQLVNRAVGRLVDMRHTQEVRFDAYHNTALNDAQANDLIIQALDARVIPVTRIPDILHQWREPNHDFGDKTAWRLFNGFTEVLKGNLELLTNRTTALHGILDASCKLVVPTDVETINALAV